MVLMFSLVSGGRGPVDSRNQKTSANCSLMMVHVFILSLTQLQNVWFCDTENKSFHWCFHSCLKLRMESACYVLYSVLAYSFKYIQCYVVCYIFCSFI